MKIKLNLYLLCLLISGFAAYGTGSAQTATNTVIVLPTGGKVYNDVITLSDLQNATKVVALSKSLSDLSRPVVSFEISMNIQGIQVTESAHSGNGASLTERQKLLLSKAKVGTKVYIEHIIIQNPGGTVSEVNSIALKVI